MKGGGPQAAREGDPVHATQPLSVRAESWEAVPGEERFLLVAASREQAVLISVGNHPDEGCLTFGHAVSTPRAIEAGRDDLFEAVPMRRAAHEDFEASGILEGHAIPLLLSLMLLSIKPAGDLRPGPHRDVAARWPDRPGPGPVDDDLSAFGLMAESPIRDVLRAGSLPYVDAPPPAARRPERIEVAVTRQAASFAQFDMGERVATDPGLVRRFEGVMPLHATVSAWANRIADRLRPNGIRLGGTGWSPRAHRHYSASGVPGERRRQAAALHPALAPVLAHVPEIVSAIDSGVPHERALDAALCRMLSLPDGASFGPGRMRRLRTIPAGLWPAPLAHCLRAASLVGSERLPTTADGWTVFTVIAPSLIAAIAEMGLAPDTVLSGPAVPWFEPLSPDEASRAASILDRMRMEGSPYEGLSRRGCMSEAIDMTVRFAITVTGRLESGGNANPDHAGISSASVRAAGRILFGDKDLGRIYALAARWHDGLDAFERGMPLCSDDLTWPALFQPFHATDDITLTCLVRHAELRAEGASSDPDEAGPGLAHCVGGYVGDCVGGRSHIVSVRRTHCDGRVERLSTVELSVNPDGSLDTVQHKGLRNGPPPHDAETALRSLMSAIRQGLVELDPVAMERREVAPGYDGIDWSSPEVRETVFSAWAPYLLRRHARAGSEAMARTVRDALR